MNPLLCIAALMSVLNISFIVGSTISENYRAKQFEQISHISVENVLQEYRGCAIINKECEIKVEVQPIGDKDEIRNPS